MAKKASRFELNVLFVALLLIVIPLSTLSVNAAEGDLALAQQYAPVFYFEKDESCFPVDVSYHLQNSYLKVFGEGEYPGIPALGSEVNFSQWSSFVPESIFQYFYLDNDKGTVDDEAIITDYQSKMSSLGYKVYSRIYSDGAATTVIQYWMFYAFNKGELNQHEGDWEMVQIVLSGGVPTNVMYSQHHSGQKATWTQVEEEDSHIKVYVARGSHANYLRSYSGKFGAANDYVGINGKILTSNDYDLEVLDSQDWLSFAGRWGEFTSEEDLLLGGAGPQGPMFREQGAMWNNPVSWGAGLSQANENIFLLEWFLYNFVLLFLLVTAISLGIAAFRIYRRHKKYGLGPRILSMLYIDGLNLKSIGNILCFIGIVLAVFALFNPWYGVSYSISGSGALDSFKTTGMTDLINVDGINGIQVSIPSQEGIVPLTSFSMPFAMFIGIGLIFTIIATIGISKSGKLGKKYIWRGIKLLLPVILICIVLLVMNTALSSMIPDTGNASVENSITGLFREMSQTPLKGQGSIPISQEGVTGQIDVQWGLGKGGQFLLFSGLILIVSGFIEIFAKAVFFESKASKDTKKIKFEKQEEPPSGEDVPSDPREIFEDKKD
ncbi:MAG: Vps62-related protein [Candidatus Thermoplasmatota archaeon]|nr:Vps62-related protein [Candidatus Thermoplasmatota archaeon]